MRRRNESNMTLAELSVEYRAHAGLLKSRIRQLETVQARTQDADAQCMLDERIRVLTAMWRETRDLAVLTERYYDRGYRRNAKYTI